MTSRRSQQSSQCFDVDKDELRELLSCDGEEEEGLPYEMVFKVNLTSSCSSSSSKRRPHSQNQPIKRARKSSLSSSSSTSPTARCGIPNKTSKETSTERRVLEKIQQDVEGMFLFEGAAGSNSDNSSNILNGHKSPVSMMLEEHMVDCGVEEEEETLEMSGDDYWTQQGLSLAIQQAVLFPSSSSNNNSPNAINNSAMQLYLNNTNQPNGVHDNNYNSNVTTTTLGSFMFLRTEPMILAQEERLGRNPYFIRTPPQVRRGEASGAALPVAMAMAMEEETSW